MPFLKFFFGGKKNQKKNQKKVYFYKLKIQKLKKNLDT